MRGLSKLNGMLPDEVITTEEPIGKLMIGVDDDSNQVKSVESKVIWYVALLSKIQGLVKTKLIETLEKMDKLVTFAKASLLPFVLFGLIIDNAWANC